MNKESQMPNPADMAKLQEEKGKSDEELLQGGGATVNLAKRRAQWKI